MIIKIYADRSYESPNLPTYYIGEVNGHRIIYAATPWKALEQAMRINKAFEYYSIHAPERIEALLK